MSDVQAPLLDCWNPREPKYVPQHQPEPAGANAYQVAGSHYKAHRYETWDVILDWGLGYLDGNAVKYLSRWRLKGGIEDLKKARHYIDKLIEVEQAKQS
jgi:hypothetical protein